LYFGLLMMQPFSNMDMVMAKPVPHCDSKMCGNRSHLPQKTNSCNNMAGCNSAMCNPFVPCGISIAQHMVLLNFSNPVFELSKKKKPTINEDIKSDYLADCWHPPKLLS
jgi:hypothetical protein